MDCIYRIKKNDYEDIYKESESGNISNLNYKIFSHNSLVLRIQDNVFKKNIENILSKYRNKNIFYEQIFIDFVLNKYDNAYYFYIYDKNEIVGCCKSAIRQNKVELVNIFIDENYRGNNYSYYMLKNMIQFLKKDKNIKKISLSVLKNNYIALNLYKKIGFIIETEIYEEIFNSIVVYMIYPI